MNNIDTKFILYIVAILLIIATIYILYKLLLSFSRTKRIELFSIDNKEDFSLEQSIYKTINNISKILKQLIVFNPIANTYEKYINKNSKIKEGMDIFTIKLLITLLFIIIYIFSIGINKQDFNTIIMLVFMIIGFISPDIYYQIKHKIHKETIDDQILRVIIIMNNCFKANKSMEQAINDVIERLNGPIELEFRKVLYDTKIGFTPSEAMMRMYQRTNIETIRTISLELALINKSGANIINIFEQLEKDIIEDRKLKLELNNIRKVNSFFYLIFMILPIIIFIVLIITNTEYLKLFSTKYGSLLAIAEVIIYSMYLYIIAKMIRRRY